MQCLLAFRHLEALVTALLSLKPLAEHTWRSSTVATSRAIGSLHLGTAATSPSSPMVPPRTSCGPQRIATRVGDVRLMKKSLKHLEGLSLAAL